MAFHVANAWDEGSKVRLFLCAFDYLSLSLGEIQSCRCPGTPGRRLYLWLRCRLEWTAGTLGREGFALTRSANGT